MTMKFPGSDSVMRPPGFSYHSEGLSMLGTDSGLVHILLSLSYFPGPSQKIVQQKYLGDLSSSLTPLLSTT